MSLLIPTKKTNELNLLNNFWDNFFSDRWQEFNAKLVPVNLASDEKNIYVSTEIAGMDKKDINIEYRDGLLTISGEKKLNHKEEGKDCFYQEIASGKFSRSIDVGDVDYEKSEAEYDNGILKIKLPKAEQVKPHRLQIK